MEIIYIGKKFYLESNTTMSSIYEETWSEGYRRTDWGFVEVALQDGKGVNIRQATKDEMILFKGMLKDIKQKNKETLEKAW